MNLARYAYLILLLGILLSAAGAIEISKGPTSSIVSREISIQTQYPVSKVENGTRELESGEFVLGTDSYKTRKLVVDLRSKDPDSDQIVYSFKVKEGSIDVYVLNSENYTLWAMGLPCVPEASLNDAQEGTLEFIPKSSGTYYLIYDNSSSADPGTSKSVSDIGSELWTVTTIETRYSTEYKTEVETIYDYERVYYGYTAFLPGLGLLAFGGATMLRSRIGISWKSGRRLSKSARERIREMPTRVEEKPRPTVRMIQLEASSFADDKVFDYIVEHEGVISLSQASEELGISIEELKTSVERLKKEGKIE